MLTPNPDPSLVGSFLVRDEPHLRLFVIELLLHLLHISAFHGVPTAHRRLQEHHNLLLV
jgi:hypothetical protein